MPPSYVDMITVRDTKITRYMILPPAVERIVVRVRKKILISLITYRTIEPNYLWLGFGVLVSGYGACRKSQVQIQVQT